jgi:glycosyltransferase involved in cell wall biosynthesis
MKFYDSVISISHAVTQNAKNQGINVANFTLIYNGIDDSVFRFSKQVKESMRVRKEFQEDIKQPLIGVINNIKDWKGQHVAIDAVKILKKKYSDLKCLLIGNVSHSEADRKYFSYLKELVTRYGLIDNVIFTGYRDDIPSLISALDVLLHTSLANEGFPRVILEIMLFSKPIIASAIGPTFEMIKDGISGFLVPPSDSKALAGKIDYLISNADIAKKMGQMARKRVEEYFSIETNVKKTEQLYSKLLNIR